MVRNRFHNKLHNFTNSFDKNKMEFWWYFDGITARVFKITLLITPAPFVQLREIKVHKGKKQKQKEQGAWEYMYLQYTEKYLLISNARLYGKT